MAPYPLVYRLVFPLVLLLSLAVTALARPTPSNPLSIHRFYRNPTFAENIQSSVNTAKKGIERDNLALMRDVPTAYWLDIKAKSQSGNHSTTWTAEGILKDASHQKPQPLVTFVIYNLPNRDCAAAASNGEICCAKKRNQSGRCNYLDTSGNCAHGLNEYKTEYIDEIAKSVSLYCPRVPMALIIEPDSLPNLITNLDNPHCGNNATKASYIEGVTYAIRTLSAACPKASIYVDAAHGGWLGWTDNHVRFAHIIRDMGVANLIRGFSINVSNYKILGEPCPSPGYCLIENNRKHSCCADPCDFISAFNPSHNEYNYAMVLANATSRIIPHFSPHIVIDSSRNGNPIKSSCSTWCNARGNGAGHVPTTRTLLPHIVDALMWIKTPGESDGCTEILPGSGDKCPRFDEACGREDSIGFAPGEPRAPEASGWFPYQIKMLARNAKFS